MSDLGVQGGDTRGWTATALDLSTCVNPYGPPPAVMEMLRNISSKDVRSHPYGADLRVQEVYAEVTRQPTETLVPGQGTSEFIWHLSHLFLGKRVGLPLPTYTEYRKFFPDAHTYGSGPSTHGLDVLDYAMSACDAVVISNPHNPTGQVLARSDLNDIAARHPSAVLVVDESYVDFLPDHREVTCIGADLDNLLVLRSPSKFYGLAGLRTGVLWSLSSINTAIRSSQMTWPVAAISANALACALDETTWAAKTRIQLHQDGEWLAKELRAAGLRPAAGSLHFRLLTDNDRIISRLVEITARHNVRIRELTQAHGVGGPAVRISAPRNSQRETASRAFRAFEETAPH